MNSYNACDRKGQYRDVYRLICKKKESGKWKRTKIKRQRNREIERRRERE